MSKIENAFKQGHKTFIPFITAGDPTLEMTEELIYALDKAGADIIELGIPFADPIADGPVIMRANIRALENGTNLKKVFEMTERVRKQTDVPIVYLMYANTIYYYGIEDFFKKCKETGVDGVIIPDVPYEEREEFDQFARAYQIDHIALVAPTSKERMAFICENATGFLYCVSSLGVTGIREEIRTNLEEMMARIKEYTTIPTAIGFGIATPEQAHELKAYTDGIIVGSALVKVIEDYGEESITPLSQLAREFVEAIRQ